MHLSSGNRLPGTVSIDCDTLEDYARGYGFEYQHEPNLIFSRAMPRLLEVLRRHRVRATFFVIGKDLQHLAHREVMRRAVDEGHELANHTWNHPRELAGLPIAQKRDEIVRNHDFVGEHLGVHMQGFRAPCYDMDPEGVQILADLRYRYDSSVHPSPVVTLFDAVVWIKSLFRVWEGRLNCFKNGFAPTRPYYPAPGRLWRSATTAPLIELPVNVWSPARIPFYGTWSLITGKRLFRLGLASLVRAGVPLNYHLHAVELLGLEEDIQDDRFACHPGMNLPLAAKTQIVGDALTAFQKHYQLMTSAELATTVAAAPDWLDDPAVVLADGCQ